MENNVNITNNNSNKIGKLFLVSKVLLFSLIGIFVIFIATKAPTDIRTKASFSGPALSLMPAEKQAKVGDTFFVQIIMNAQDETVSATKLHLTYDPTSIRINSFTVGSPLPVVLVQETHNDGNIRVTLGANPSTPFHGSGIIGSFEVEILSANQSEIRFSPFTQVAVLGKNSSTIDSKTGSVITGISGKINPTRPPYPSQIQHIIDRIQLQQ